MFRGPTQVHILNGITIGSCAFTVFMAVTDTPTNKPCYLIYSNWPHLASAAMRPNNNSSDKELMRVVGGAGSS